MTAEKKYFYLSNGQPIGPLTLEEIIELYRLGTIHRSTFLHFAEIKTWRTLNQLDDLHLAIREKLGSTHLPEAPPSSETGQYYTGIPGEAKQGPFTTKQVSDKIKAKEFTKNHFVYDSFVNDWVPLFTHPDFDRRRLNRINDNNSAPTAGIVPVPRSFKLKRVARAVFASLAIVLISAPPLAKNHSFRCALGDLRHCQQLGYDRLKKGHESDAFSYFEKACSGGFLPACHDAGLSLKKQNEVTKALFYFQKACEGKYGPACHQWAIHLPKNSDQGASLIAKGCEYGSGEACLSLGQVDLANRNLLRAQKYFQKSCDLQFAPGCNGLSLLLSDLHDKNGQIKALETSCSLSNGNGCTALGQIYYDDGILGRADEFMLKGCDFGSPTGCGGAANMAFLRGDGDVGEKLAHLACELGDAIGCGLLGSYLNELKKTDESEKYFKKACEFRSGLSCYTLSQLLKAKRAPASEIKALKNQACAINKKYCSM